MKISKFEFVMIGMLLIAALIYFATRGSKFVEQCMSEGGVPIVVKSGKYCSYITESQCKDHNGIWENIRTCKMPDGSFLFQTDTLTFDKL